MHVSAQRVISDAGDQGINAFVYVDRVDPWPSDPTALLQQDPGTLMFHSFEVAPGGNRVRSYLDVVVPDSASVADLSWIFNTLSRWVQAERLPVTGTLGQAAFCLGMEQGLVSRWRDELSDLSDHAQVCAASYLGAVPRPLPGDVQAGLTTFEHQLLVEAAQRGDSSAVLDLLRGLASTDRLEAIVDAIQTYAGHCEVNQGPVRSFLIARVPGVLANHYFPTLGSKRFNDFIDWSMSHPQWADDVRQGAAQSGEALREAVRRTTPG